ncbi:GAF and ANTAR domain-containing protein [Nonomuraea sp. PA05]|uniref:GAF and ANTAR domain-containing protein n=1 Tax=Nonomuraea sp. PA05 TaxID=2604466 RepID=UPI0011D9292F|nr:GAF and ANTAR domain-containing protein [Nonomuraea sp. PA05]TYB62312.1 GAF and ANTAR domain-containing protein [Nonomuraea sp. PA05]
MGPTDDPVPRDAPAQTGSTDGGGGGLDDAFLHELTAALLATSGIEAALNELATAASRITPGSPMAGVTLRLGGRVRTIASSEADALLIDEIQYDNGSDGGPCLEAIDTGLVVRVDDLATEHRWGEYSALLLAHGLRSIYSHPLWAGEVVIGALNMYAPTTAETAFGPAARAAIARAAEHTELLLHAVVQAARHVEITGQLREALAHRALIDQAIGILMGQRRCTADQAFTLIRRAGQTRNRSPAEVAADIIVSFTGQGPGPPPFADPL